MARKPRQFTDEQQSALDLAKSKYAEYRRSRKTALERARRAAEAEVAERRREAAKAILAAYNSGVAMRTIGREAMKTSDYVTIRAIIGEVDLDALREERAEQIEAEAKAIARAEQNLTVTITPLGTYVVTLAGAELEQARAWANWESQKPTPKEFRSAEFKRHDTGAWEPVTDGWIAELGEEHPVVVYASKDKGREKLNEAAGL